jgi:hypothetical protein
LTKKRFVITGKLNPISEIRPALSHQAAQKLRRRCRISVAGVLYETRLVDAETTREMSAYAGGPTLLADARQ